jgi:hypothetical protein
MEVGRVLESNAARFDAVGIASLHRQIHASVLRYTIILSK